jgi:arylformamidase
MGDGYYDISQRVRPETAVWPGDTTFSARRVMEISGGASCNVTTITMSVHCGTHADAPLHFEEGAESAGEVPLASYLGPARVHHVRSRGRVIDPGDLPPLGGVERLLLRCEGAPDETRFGVRALSPAAAEAISAAGLKLVGLDGQSVDEADSKTLPSHKILRRGRVAILENLDLSLVPEGDYELIALPLRLMGVDASPVRAILRPLSR